MSKELIYTAYEILGDVTPIKYDCGKLCSSYCCNNNSDEETLGMWLLPYEKEMLLCETGYSFTKAEDGTECVFCSGYCNRKMRPFSCRIYPFYPHITDGGRKIEIRIDPRARLSCPIANPRGHIRGCIEFKRYVKMAVRVLMKSEIIRDDLIHTSDFLYEIEEMQKKLLGL